MKDSTNQKFFEEASEFIPEGLNSTFRNFEQIGGTPIFMNHGSGCYLYDENRNKYLDFSLGWGPLILGHNHRVIRKVLKDSSKNGYLLGTPTLSETRFAKLLVETFPSIEQVRLQTSGTEAMGLALRLARAFTKKDYIVTVHGSYHGHQNDTLLKTEGGDITVPASLGIPSDVHKYNLRVHFNDIESLKKLLSSRNDIAAVLVEPVPGNMGLIIPAGNYLKEVRDLCTQNNILLIFDEVISGLRVSLGGAQELYGILPDVTVLGKAIGGGLPIGAVGARKEIMNLINSSGVYAAGTYAGNPLSVKAGIATLEYMRSGHEFSNLASLTAYIADTLNVFTFSKGYPMCVQSLGSLFGIYFGVSTPPVSWKDVITLDNEAFKNYHIFMRENGVYLSPSHEDLAFISVVHRKKHATKFIKLTKAFLDMYYRSKV